MLYELKDGGSSSLDSQLYGCLNSECASSLKSGLIANQFILMFVLLGLAFLNMFSIGLASHTMKFDMHYKNPIRNTIIFIMLIGIIVGGSVIISTTEFKVLEVNPDSMESVPINDIPPLVSDTLYKDSMWYPLTLKF